MSPPPKRNDRRSGAARALPKMLALALSVIASVALASACSSADTCLLDDDCGASGTLAVCSQQNGFGDCTGIYYLASDGTAFQCASCSDCGAAEQKAYGYCASTGDMGGGAGDAAARESSVASDAQVAPVDAAVDAPVDPDAALLLIDASSFADAPVFITDASLASDAASAAAVSDGGEVGAEP